jgi:hypothetical protein
MPIRRYLSFQNRNKESDLIATEIKAEDIKPLSKNFRVAALALGYQGTNYFYTGRSNFEPSPYDFDRIIQAVDTDSYVKQAISKYKDLFWKEGWKIVRRKSRSRFISLSKNRLYGNGHEETILRFSY